MEGAALGTALLRAFAAPGGAMLTLATTHSGELKALKYADEGVFENAAARPHLPAWQPASLQRQLPLPASRSAALPAARFPPSRAGRPAWPARLRPGGYWVSWLVGPSGALSLPGGG